VPLNGCENSARQIAPSKLSITMASASTASSVTGQGALLGLPSKSQLSKRGIDSYSLPENLIQDKDTLMTSTEEGLDVYKVTKVCGRALCFVSAPPNFPLFCWFPRNLLWDDTFILYPCMYISNSKTFPLFLSIHQLRFCDVFSFDHHGNGLNFAFLSLLFSHLFSREKSKPVESPLARIEEIFWSRQIAQRALKACGKRRV
jgi:hypothetical protein